MKIRSLLNLAEISKKLFILNLIISVFSTLLGLTMPIYLKNVIDKFQKSGIELSDILIISILFASSVILGSVSLYLFKYIGSRSMFKIRSNIWENILKLDLPTIQKYESGEIISRLKNDIEELNLFLTNTIPNALNYLLTFVGALIMLFILDYKIMLITIAVIPIICLVIFPIGTITYNLSLKLQDQLSLFTSKLNNILTNIKLVKAYTSEAYEYQKIKKILNNILDIELKDAKVKALITPIMSVVTIGTILFIVGYAIIRISNGSLSTGTFIAILYYVLQIIPAIISFTTLYTDVQKVRGANVKIRDLLSENNLETPNLLLRTAKLPLEKLTINNISFSFGEKQILKNINLIINPGENIAIVGPSGAGKSTLFDLILGIHKNYTGNIFYGNKNIKDINIIDWRNNISYVPQENNIMSGTILDNIVYGQKKITCFDRILDVTQKADLMETIDNNPKKFLSATGENGAFLSGGQRQRIALSRAIMKDKNIYLLDEFSSNLDSQSENRLIDNISEIMANKTCLIIAHRMSTIKNADRILFMDNGVITGLASHKELYASHTLYRLFIDSQNCFK
ncbi:ABC transporter ATP-binding protein [Staphylococcus argenteus]|nr:ABC transporter ATP-binding protein [Staphylococcus argenteus]GJF54598.1 antibiotic ABC transporter ATP-binding protein [Staphylococcus argenteus]GJF60606.1 antibiotic ABC transporter ATP-binding protein [Staphylococcus argenteus]GJF73614.1 antibiotic ABC transporter ATP-binding protein [Staphylococcus argenteus]GJF86321.1 antibiotic ABC transporter ATP-binding protein [Staphylococcus argenteus]GJF92355.1 antibiotic ABC transporter ATP-binding protein [Staphylococcus argenteus]